MRAEQIRPNPHITNIVAHGINHKIILFTDDVIHMVSNPFRSMWEI